MTQPTLSTQRCHPQSGKQALDDPRIDTLLGEVPGWQVDDARRAIAKDFRFKDFHHTLGFINAVGFMANQQDHHPDIEAGYGHCRLRWSTHDVGGLSLNDFICAARVDGLLAQ